MTKLSKVKECNKGFVLVGVMIFISLSAMISANMLASSKTTAQSRVIVKTRSQYFYDVEKTLNSAVIWLQDNSVDMAGLFTEAEFESEFDLVDPATAANEGAFFQTPSMVRIKGTNNAPMLSNNAFFGQAAFPIAPSISGGSSTFNSVNSFTSNMTGPANARIVMVWARKAGNSYEPVYRIDVLTGNNPDRGVHSFSYVYSKAIAGASLPGFFGKDSFVTGTPNNQCSSYQWVRNAADTAWVKGAQKSNCSVGSEGPVELKSKINGSASSLQDPGITLKPPGGQANSYCEGSSCGSIPWPDPGNWNALCPSGGVDKNYSSNGTLGSPGCYKDLWVKNNKTLTLTDYDNPYMFREFDLDGEIKFGTIPEGEKITIYVEKFTGNKFNGGQIVGGWPNAPHQIEIKYVGTDTLKLNGNASFNAMLEAPYARVEMNGNFTFNGGVMAESLDVRGKAKLYFSENAGGATALSDISYVLKKATQRYR